MGDAWPCINKLEKMYITQPIIGGYILSPPIIEISESLSLAKQNSETTHNVIKLTENISYVTCI